MLYRGSFVEDSGPGVDALHDGGLDFHFHYAPEFATQTLAGMLDSLVRVSRRVAQGHYASILSTDRSRAEFLSPDHRMRRRAITHSEECHVPLALVRRPKLTLTRRPGSTPSEKQG